EGRRRVDALELERDEGGGILLLPRGRREHDGHQRLDQVVVPVENRDVLDRFRQLRRLSQRGLDRSAQRAAKRARVGRDLPLPELDQRREAQFYVEGKLASDLGQLGREIRRGGGWRIAHEETSRDLARPRMARFPAGRGRYVGALQRPRRGISVTEP